MTACATQPANNAVPIPLCLVVTGVLMKQRAAALVALDRRRAIHSLRERAHNSATTLANTAGSRVVTVYDDGGLRTSFW